ADKAFVQRRQQHAPSFVALWILLFQMCSDQIQIRLPLLLRYIRFQTRDDVGSRVSAAPPEAFRLKTDGHSDVSFHPVLEIGRSNPDDDEALVVECELLPDDAGISTEPALPEAVTHDHCRSRARMVFFCKKVAPHERLDPQRGEEFRRDKPPLQA